MSGDNIGKFNWVIRLQKNLERQGVFNEPSQSFVPIKYYLTNAQKNEILNGDLEILDDLDVFFQTEADIWRAYIDDFFSFPEILEELEKFLSGEESKDLGIIQSTEEIPEGWTSLNFKKYFSTGIKKWIDWMK